MPNHAVKIKTDAFDLSELGNPVQRNQTIMFKLKSGNRTTSATVIVPDGLFTENGNIEVTSAPWPVRTVHSQAGGPYTIEANRSTGYYNNMTGTINVGSGTGGGDDDDHGHGKGPRGPR